jgi:hypothetical protein
MSEYKGLAPYNIVELALVLVYIKIYQKNCAGGYIIKIQMFL